MKFTLLAGSLFFLLLYTGTAFAQTAGDYRSAATGNWATAATWQTYDGTTWNAAVTAPPVAGEAIEIQPTHTVSITATTTIGKVTVDNGATLVMNGGFITTLNSDGLTNNGTVTAANGGVLSGAGTFTNSTNGVLNVLLSTILAVPTTNNGTVNFSQTSAIQAATLTNNNFVNWIDGVFYFLNAATLINNDSIAIQVGTVNVQSNSTGTWTNAAGAVIYVADPATNLTVTGAVSFTNAGTVKGFGTVDFVGSTASTGTIAPGDNSTSATFSVSPTMVATGTPTLQTIISPGGGTPTAGTTYDQVAVTGAGVNISNATLTVLDAGLGDATSTVYTVFTSAGTITGTFATVNLPSTLGAVAYNANSVTVTRLTPLPLTWGSFTVTTGDNQAQLSWTTLEETNTAHFTIQRSTDGVNFAPIGTVAAKGNSSVVSSYSFTDANPSLQGFNYYRLVETDLDGKSNYSVIRVVSFGNAKAVIVQTSPNPVRDQLNIVVQEDNITILLNDMSGKVLKTMRLAQGFHQTSLGDLPAGVYQLTIIQGQNKIDSRQILKL